MDDALLRQRRNLIVFSTGLILFQLLDANFGDKGSLFGGSIIFDKEKSYILNISLWLGFAYFLWRYWLFGGKTAFTDSFNRFKSIYIADEHLRKRMLRIHSDYVINEFQRARPGTTYLPLSLPSLTWMQNKKAYIRVYFEVLNPNNSTRFPVNIEKATTVNINLDASIRSLLITIFHDQHFSEYVLPYIFAGAAIMIGIIKLYLFLNI